MEKSEGNEVKKKNPTKRVAWRIWADGEKNVQYMKLNER